jgi:Brp/Blh family beta-carotene 15,15'-monooxygenase
VSICAASGWLPPREESLIALLVLIFIFGIPHGALDPLYARERFRLMHGTQWVLFAILYLVPVLAVICFSQLLPGWFLLTFLLLAAVHFARDIQAKCAYWVRLLYGGSPIVLPAVSYNGELEGLFAAIVPLPLAARFQEGLAILAWPWILALVVGVAVLARRERQAALEVAATAVVCVVAPPLEAFTVFFCGMHSARHILLSVLPSDRSSGATCRSIQEAVLSAVLPMFGTLVLVVAYWGIARGALPGTRLFETIFVILAALTVPHVLLVDGLFARANRAERR